jgi:hypothetical protein
LTGVAEILEEEPAARAVGDVDGDRV